MNDPLNPEDLEYSYDEAVDEIARRYGVPKEVYTRMVRQESGGDDSAVSPKGARSRWQIMPGTAKGLGIDVNDPLQAAEGGLRILRDNYKQFKPYAQNEKHAWMMAVAGYHTNPKNVLKDLKKGGVGLPMTSDGSITTRDHVLRIFDGLEGSALGEQQAPQMQGGASFRDMPEYPMTQIRPVEPTFPSNTINEQAATQPKLTEGGGSYDFSVMNPQAQPPAQETVAQPAQVPVGPSSEPLPGEYQKWLDLQKEQDSPQLRQAYNEMLQTVEQSPEAQQYLQRNQDAQRQYQRDLSEWQRDLQAYYGGIDKVTSQAQPSGGLVSVRKPPATQIANSVEDVLNGGLYTATVDLSKAPEGVDKRRWMAREALRGYVGQNGITNADVDAFAAANQLRIDQEIGDATGAVDVTVLNKVVNNLLQWKGLKSRDNSRIEPGLEAELQERATQSPYYGVVQAMNEEKLRRNEAAAERVKESVENNRWQQAGDAISDFLMAGANFLTLDPFSTGKRLYDEKETEKFRKQRSEAAFKDIEERYNGNFLEYERQLNEGREQLKQMGYPEWLARHAAEYADGVTSGLTTGMQSLLVANEVISGATGGISDYVNPLGMLDKTFVAIRDGLLGYKSMDEVVRYLTSDTDLDKQELYKTLGAINDALKPDEILSVDGALSPNLLRGAGSLTWFLIGGKLLGGTKLATAFLGSTQSISQIYDELRKRGLTNAEAAAYASVFGTAVGSTEIVGAAGKANALVEAFKVGRKMSPKAIGAVAKILRESAEEGGQELVQGILTDASIEGLSQTDKDLIGKLASVIRELPRQVSGETVEGGVIGGILGAGTGGVQVAGDRMTARPAEQKGESPGPPVLTDTDLTPQQPTAPDEMETLKRDAQRYPVLRDEEGNLIGEAADATTEAQVPSQPAPLEQTALETDSEVEDLPSGTLAESESGVGGSYVDQAKAVVPQAGVSRPGGTEGEVGQATPATTLPSEAQTLVESNPSLQSISLIGSSVEKGVGGGQDVDILFEFAPSALSDNYNDDLVAMVEGLDAEGVTDIWNHDMFVKVGDRYFHKATGAGTEFIENTDYAAEQSGRPVRVLASQSLTTVETKSAEQGAQIPKKTDIPVQEKAKKQEIGRPEEEASDDGVLDRTYKVQGKYLAKPVKKDDGRTATIEWKTDNNGTGAVPTTVDELLEVFDFPTGEGVPTDAETHLLDPETPVKSIRLKSVRYASDGSVAPDGGVAGGITVKVQYEQGNVELTLRAVPKSENKQKQETAPPKQEPKGKLKLQDDVDGFDTEAFRKRRDAIPLEKNEKGQLIAPNGKPSNLNETLWRTVRTPEFIEWFGDWINDPENASKVVDENGEPLQVTHVVGTGLTALPGVQDTFDTFRVGKELGAHFATTPAQSNALMYADDVGHHTIPAFLNIRTPIRLTDTGTFSQSGVTGELRGLGILRSEDEYYSAVDMEGRDDLTPFLQDRIKQAGFDGAVYLNRREGTGQDGVVGEDEMSDEEFRRAAPDARDSYIAFQPNQIKSIFNRGSFSESDSISLRLGSREGKASIRKLNQNAQRVLSALAKIMPDAQVVLHDDSKAFNATVEKEYGRKIEDGVTAAGYYDNGSTIHINTKIFDKAVLPHEFAHAVFKSLGTNEKWMADAYNDLQLTLSPKQKAKYDKHADLYHPRDEKGNKVTLTARDKAIMREEFLAEWLADVATTEDKGLLAQAKKWFNRLLAKLGLAKSIRIDSADDVRTFARKFAEAYQTGRPIDVSRGVMSGQVAGDNGAMTRLPLAVDPTKVKGGRELKLSLTPQEQSLFGDIPRTDIKDILSTFKKENGREARVWFWAADSIARGDYYNPNTGVRVKGLDGGIGYALDNHNQKTGAAWATSMADSMLQNRLNDADFIFIVSGSLNGMHYSNLKAADVVQAELENAVGSEAQFIRNFRKIVNGKVQALHSNIQNLVEGTFPSSIQTLFDTIKGSGKRGSILQGILPQQRGDKPISHKPDTLPGLMQRIGVPTQQEINEHILQPMARENFGINDVILVIRPDGTFGKAGEGQFSNVAEHGTYKTVVGGEVMGVPTNIYKHWQLHDIFRQMRGDEVDPARSLARAQYAGDVQPTGEPTIDAPGVKLSLKPTVEGFDSEAFIKERDSIPLVKDDQGRLLAPNGQPSNLNETLWRTVRTENFKKWGGGEGWPDLVKDENGEPAVMYHGTDADYDAFDREQINRRHSYSLGFHFTNSPSEASTYADSLQNAATQWNPRNKFAVPPVEGGAVMPVFLKTANPLVEVSDSSNASIKADEDRGLLAEQVIESRKTSKPYDGIVITAPNGNQNVIVFDPNQIKSIFNSGEFSEADSMMRRVSDPESERYLNKVLPTVEIQRLLPVVESRVRRFKGGEVELEVNPEGSELIRRLLGGPPIKGTFLPRGFVRTAIAQLEEGNRIGREKGMDVSKAETLLANLREVAAANEGTAVAWAFEDAIAEERGHRALYFARTAPQRTQIPKTVARQISAIARSSARFRREYGNESIDRQAEEAFVKIATGQDYGWSEQEQQTISMEFLKGFLRNNKDADIDKLAGFGKAYEEQIKPAIESIQREGSAQPADSADVQQPEGRGSPESTQGGRREEGGADSGRDDSRKTKLRSLPQTLRESGLDVDDARYAVFGDAAAQAEANKKLSDLGFEGAVQYLRNLENFGKTDGVMSYMVQGVLRDQAVKAREQGNDALELELRTLANEIGLRTAEAMTEAGQFIQSAAHVAQHIESVMARAYQLAGKKGLTPQQARKFEEKGEAAIEHLAQLTALRNENQALKDRIKKLKEAADDPTKRPRVSGVNKYAKKVAKRAKKELNVDLAALAREIRDELGLDPDAAMRMVAYTGGPHIVVFDEQDVEVEGMMRSVSSSNTSDKLATYGAGLILGKHLHEIDREAFYKEMRQAFGDDIEPMLPQIFADSFAKRDAVLAKVRADMRFEKMKEESPELSDAEIREAIAKKEAESAKKRAAGYQARRLANIYKPKVAKQKQDLLRIIEDITTDLDAADMARQIVLKESVDTSRKNRPTFLEAQRLIKEAELQQKTERQNILKDIAGSEKKLKEIQREEFLRRRLLKESNSALARQYRALEDGRTKYYVKEFLKMLGESRSLMASVDLSGALRQGLYLNVTDTRRVLMGIDNGSDALLGSALKSMLKQVSLTEKGNKRFADTISQIEDHPDFHVMLQMGVDFAFAGKGAGAIGQGEEVVHTEYLRKIKGLRNFLDMSEQTYAGYLDPQRAIVAHQLIQELSSQGMTFDSHPEEYKAAGALINIATGRGNISTTKLKAQLEAYGNWAFAPRYAISRFQLLAHITYGWATMPPTMRKIAGKKVARFHMAMTLPLLALGALGYLSLDPDDDDFLKIRVGDKARFEILAGLQPVVRMLGRMIKGGILLGTGQIKQSDFAYRMIGVPSRFLRGKLAPLPSLAVDWIYGKNFINQPFTWMGTAENQYEDSAILSRVIPLAVKEIATATLEDGAVGFALTFPGMLGVGVSYYEDRPEKKVKLLPPTVKGIRSARNASQALEVYDRAIRENPKRGEAFLNEIKKKYARARSEKSWETYEQFFEFHKIPYKKISDKRKQYLLKKNKK